MGASAETATSSTARVGDEVPTDVARTESPGATVHRPVALPSPEPMTVTRVVLPRSSTGGSKCSTKPWACAIVAISRIDRQPNDLRGMSASDDD